MLFLVAEGIEYCCPRPGKNDSHPNTGLCPEPMSTNEVAFQRVWPPVHQGQYPLLSLITALQSQAVIFHIISI